MFNLSFTLHSIFISASSTPVCHTGELVSNTWDTSQWELSTQDLTLRVNHLLVENKSLGITLSPDFNGLLFSNLGEKRRTNGIKQPLSNAHCPLHWELGTDIVLFSSRFVIKLFSYFVASDSFVSISAGG